MLSFDASLAGIFVGSAVLAMLLALAGMLASRTARGAEARVEADANSIGVMATATLALLGFMLTFTFGMTGSRFEQRQALLMEEVNAIGTAYLRADLASDPHASIIRGLLREYVDLRVRVLDDPYALDDAMRKSERIHERLWHEVVQMSTQNEIGIPETLLVQSLNDVIDLQSDRLAVSFLFRIPVALWIGLAVLAALGMAVAGYQIERPARRSMIMCGLLCVAFACVITLIANLDRAASGTVVPNQRPLLDLQGQLRQPE
jgi:hypothetical protein